MKSYKVLHVAPDHVIVDDGSGPLKVATSHRHVATVQKILKMAEGGTVQRMSGASGNPKDQVVQEYDPSTGAPITSSAESGDQPPGIAPAEAMFGGNPAQAPDITPAQGMFGQGATTPAWPPPGATAGQVQEGAPVATSGTPPEQPPGAPPPLPGLPSGQGPPVPGTAEQLAGIQAKAGAEAGLGQAQKSAWDQHQEQMAQLTAGLQKDYAANQAQADAISKDIMAGKTDPNRLWHSMGTGQKIGATIGMILGGIGAGVTGGPNYAAQVIDKAIDRDMEAQKMDLGKKQSQLNYYMQRGHSMQSSYLLAKADAMDRTAAQILAAQGQFGGQIAQAQAVSAAGVVKQQADMYRKQGYAMTLQNKERELNMQAQQYQMQAMRQLLSGVSGGGGFDRRMLEMPGMDKYRERAVDLPDGTVGFATTKEEAAKATEGFMAAAKLKEKVSGYRRLLEQGSPLTTDRSSAHAMRADILSEMGHLHGLNRLSDEDLKLFKEQVPDITDIIKPNAGKVLSKLGDSIMDASWSEQQRFLTTPRNKRPPRSK